MKIEAFVYGVVQTNCYIITNENTNEAIIIDPADQASEIMRQLDEQNKKLVAILLTHGHFDHMMAAADLSDHYNIPIYAHEEEKELMGNYKMNGAFLIRSELTLTPTILIKDKDILSLIGMNIRVIHTPGHTIGSVCYYFEEDSILISGDTLFNESIGRTDLPTGNSLKILESIKQNILCLPDNVVVYTGHGESTTIGHEKLHNPFLSESNFWD